MSSTSETSMTQRKETVPPTAMSSDDVLAAWANHPRVRSRLTDTYANYLVLGESGLGKTTFISNITNSYKMQHAGRLDGGATLLSHFMAEPDSLRTVLAPMAVPECSRRVRISIQDAPGWGDDINLMRYLRIIASFLLEQRAKDYAKLAGARALDETAMCGVLEHSITACIYFVPPHRIKKVDLIQMAAISQMVPLIPVIAKADCMTDRELSAYRAELLSMFKQPSSVLLPKRDLPDLEVSVFGFSNTILDSLAMHRLPLALSCSRESEPVADPGFLKNLGLQGVDAPAQPVRQYRWGNVYPLSRGHSDLIVLKRLLLGDRVESLYALLDDSYKRYVEFCGAFEERDKQIALLVQDACQASASYLEHDKSVKARAALESAKSALQMLTDENRLLVDALAAVEKEREEQVSRRRAGNVTNIAA